MNREDMTPEQFCYWLNGHFDLSDTDTISAEQVKVIKDHLGLVFDQKAKGINLFEDIRPTIKPYPTFFPDGIPKPIC